METEQLRTLRARRHEEGPIFRVGENACAVLDAEAVQRVEAANFADLTMRDGFADAVRGRRSEEISWAQLRSAWSRQMRHLTAPGSLKGLAQRMTGVLDAEVGRRQDLVWLAERAVVEPLVPMIVGGLDERAQRRLVREVHSKVGWVLSDVDAHRAPRGHRMRMFFHQLVAGFEVRRELRARARGKRARQQDLADPVVEMLDKLGIGRAVDAVTALLTAITGSPGAAGACLLFELSRRPEWQERLEAEFNTIPLEELYRSPTRSAPATTAFVKELLRIWSSPPLVTRAVRTDIRDECVSMKRGEIYLLSSYLIHHDPDTWTDAEAFRPERWLGGDDGPRCPHGPYAPFGWAPKSCIGANLGMAQLVLFAHLFCTRYRMQTESPGRAQMAVASVVRPKDFRGTLVRREEVSS
ncbi:MAG TPA: cytochrome P450 [Kofleriaceae bacterium]|nr:cytochrome P450 [Kofleriaceae bacterium]